MAELTIEVKFIGYLKEYTGSREPQQLTLSQGSVVSDVFVAFNIPVRLIKVVTINDIKADFDTVLKDNDKIILQPVMLGG